ARLLALDDTLRRGSFHSGEESCARARTSDSHTVSGRFSQDRALSRLGGRVADGETRYDTGRPLSYEYRRRLASRTSPLASATKRDEADRDGDGRKTDRVFSR